jgi:hypothetical protein
VNGRFKSSLDADVAADKLNALKQGGSQPVSQYVGKVQQLLIRVPNMDMDSRVRSFIRGLQPHLGQRLRELRPKTVEEAYEQAIRIEGSFGTTVGKSSESGTKRFHGAAAKTQSVNAMDADEPQREETEAGSKGGNVTLAAVQRMVEQSWKAQQRKGRGHKPGGGMGGTSSDVVCYRCGDRGHFANECKGERLCYGCKKPGHVKADCPERSGEGEGSGAPGREK